MLYCDASNKTEIKPMILGGRWASLKSSDGTLKNKTYATSHAQVVPSTSSLPSWLGYLYIKYADIAHSAEEPHKIKAVMRCVNPIRTRRWDKWSFPPLNGVIPLKSRDVTATVVSRIGTARRITGIAKDFQFGFMSGFIRIVSVERIMPRNNAPASPM